MKALVLAAVGGVVFLSGCAVEPYYPDLVPENNLKGIVAEPIRPAAHFLNKLELGPPIGPDAVTPETLRVIYPWRYVRNQTFGQHLDAWAYRFGYRLDWKVPQGWDPYVQSDGTFVGDFYAALEDLSFFAEEGKPKFHVYRGVQRMRTKLFEITVYEKHKFIRVVRRDPQREYAEVERDERERAEAAQRAAWVAFFNRFSSDQ